MDIQAETSPVLSIVVPTKGREAYVKDVVDHILSWSDDRFELLVQNNSDSDELSSCFSKHDGDSRFSYFFEPGWLSVIDNFDLAVGRARGSVVTIIGDDDGVHKSVIDVAQFMIENAIDSVHSVVATYVWPDLESKYNASYFSAKLRVQSSYSQAYSQVLVDDELSASLNRGGTSIGNMPRIYYGLVRKEVIDSIISKCGSLFPGPSPDMASSVALSLTCKDSRFYDFPLFIAGSCVKSTAGQGLQKKHEGEIEDVPHLPKSCKELWSSVVPEFWSGSTIWAESFLKSFSSCNNEEPEGFNYSFLYARCLVFSLHRWQKVVSCIDKNPHVNYFGVLLSVMNVWGDRVRYFLPKLVERVLGRSVESCWVKDGVLTISKAMIELDYFVRQKQTDSKNKSL